MPPSSKLCKLLGPVHNGTQQKGRTDGRTDSVTLVSYNSLEFYAFENSLIDALILGSG